MTTRLLSLFLLVASLPAAVELPAILASGMVIQAEVPVTLWGWADPGEAVVVTQGGVEVGRAVGAGPATPWTVVLPAQRSGPVADLTITGKNRLVLDQVVAGEVWRCAGQSNMDMKVEACGPAVADPAAKVAEAQGDLRWFREESAASGTPNARTRGTWVRAEATTIKSCSAVAYFFGRYLQQHLKRPVGLVITAVGGTPAEAWTPASWLDADPEHQRLRAEAQATRAQLEPRNSEDDRQSKAWSAAVTAAKAAGTPAPPRPAALLTVAERRRLNDTRNILTRSSLHFGKIMPIERFTVRGVVWYQGESNAGHADHYARLLTGLITGWRAGCGSEVPFILVALAGYGTAAPWDERADSFALVREAQQAVADQVPGVGLVSAVDLGQAGNIHPPFKQEVGERAARWALQHTYQTAIIGDGPRLGTVIFAPGKATIAVGGAADGLVLRGSGGFALAGEDRRFFPATATVVGSTIVITAPSVSAPVAYRYAFANFPACSLYNGAGLPALPARSDRWPVTAP